MIFVVILKTLHTPPLLFQFCRKTTFRAKASISKFSSKMPSLPSQSSPRSPPGSVPGHVTAQIDDSRIVLHFLKVHCVLRLCLLLIQPRRLQ